MALATVTGFLKDVGLVSLGNRSPELVFEIDDIVTIGSTTLIPQEPISVIPASDGSFSVSLNPSADTNPFAPYKLTVNWQSKGINRSITPSWRIFVPAGGGNIADMISVVYPTKVITKGDKGDKGDAGNAVQQAALDAITAKNTEQDGRLTTIEGAGYVPVWKTATAYTAGQKVISPGGDVVAAIANHTSTTYIPANWTASTQDGRIKTIETTAVFNGDARLLATDSVDGVFFGIVDKNDKQSALMLGMDGDLTPDAAVRVGGSLGVQTAALDSGETFAVVDSQDRIIFSDTGTGTAAATGAFPTTDWAHWGDSLTDNAVTGTDAWVTQLAALTGRNHFNGGWYQQTAAQIAARQGGLPALVTVTGNATAGSGNTVVTSIVNKPVLQSSTRTVAGTLAGIPGVIRELTTGNVTFTPDAAGVYPVPAGSVFTPTDGTTYRGRVMTIWSGRNDVPLSTDPQLVVSSIRAAVDYLSPNVKRVIVMEVMPSAYDDAPTMSYTATLNAAIKAAFPAHWLDIASWLRTPAAATAAGITFTTQDNTDIAAGFTPTSFRLDSTHINATGCKAVAYRVNDEAKRRGWLV